MDLTAIIYVSLLLYLLIVGSLIRVFQVIRKRDELMRVITAQWIQESSSPLSADPK
jgi:type IV secretory pathway VirB3-like protein